MRARIRADHENVYHYGAMLIDISFAELQYYNFETNFEIIIKFEFKFKFEHDLSVISQLKFKVLKIYYETSVTVVAL